MARANKNNPTILESLRNAWKVGDIRKKLTVEAAKFSGSAKEKIEALGGKAEVK